MRPTVLIWLRNDLRIHDNTALSAGAEIGAPFVVVCVDPRQFGPEAVLPLTGLRKHGRFYTKFLVESLENLRKNYQALGGDLLIRFGKPEEILPALAQSLQATSVFFQEEVTPEETAVEGKVVQACANIGVKAVGVWGLTMVPLEVLPFSLEELPDVFTQFKNKVEQRVKMPALLSPPTSLPALPQGIEPGELPTLAQLGHESFEEDARRAIEWKGGETEALARLNHYFFRSEAIATYKETRNGLIGPDFSTKFSAYLSFGCLSPRLVYHEVLRFEAERVANDSTYWVLFEMLWRDYFKFIAKKYGSALFKTGGLKGLNQRPRHDPKRFEKWATGQTGIPFVDAGMRELTQTGYLNNRLRQNVASFLVSDLKGDWRFGAELFEHFLIDYDPASNYGNWNYVAGVGNDPRGHRYFNVLKQAMDYDSEGEYVRLWVPELSQAPRAYIHTPWQIPAKTRDAIELELGKDYPQPIVGLRERT